MLDSVRLDKWLFAVRIFKSRSLAAKAIDGGKVKIDGTAVKPHRTVVIGDSIDVRKESRLLRFEVTGLIEKRVGAQEALKNYVMTEDPDLQPEIRDMVRLFREMDRGNQARGKPNKKDRRQILKVKGHD